MIVAAVGAIMLIATWGTWPDPVTDFGKEVYIAWRLALGQHLYTDVAYHLGPLSPYVNALLFRIFGPSLLTLELFNILLLAVMVALVYRLIHRIAGTIAATAAGVSFVTLFAFMHFTSIADYNFVCPYDHAHTHGLLLGLIGLTAAERFTRTRGGLSIFIAGLAVGLAFLTRAELFLAAAAGVGTVLGITPSPGTPGEGGGEGIQRLMDSEGPHLNPLPDYRERGKKLILFLIGLLIPILITQLLLGFRAVEGSWPIIFDRSVTANPFYRDSMGTLDIGVSLVRLILWTFAWLVVLLPPIALPRCWSAIGFIWGAALTFLIGKLNNPADAFAPLPIALIGCAILAARRSPQERLITFGLLAFAFVLLAKIFLNARIYHYGFVLAMPATLLVVAIGIGWTPPPIRASFLGALIVLIAAYVNLGWNYLSHQTFVVGDGPNQFRADWRGAEVEQALVTLRQKAAANQSLIVMPEGALLNFLAVMPNPTPYWSFNPPYSFFAPGSGEAAGEAKIEASLQSHPPDWIVLVPEDLSDFGTARFGKDYGLQISAFVKQHYRTVWHSDYGAILLRRVVYN